MKSLFVICSLLLFIGFSHALIRPVDTDTIQVITADDSKCAPAQWEGLTSSWYPELDTLALSNVSYDFDNKMLRFQVEKMVFDDEEEGKTQFTRYSMILRFDKKKAFFFSEDDQKCKVKQLDHDFYQWCIPKDARTMRSHTIGGSLSVNSYLFNITHPGMKDGAWMYFESTDSNIPVSAKYQGSKVGGVTDFYDITSGIADPSVFDPPDFCDENDVKPWGHTHHKSRSPSQADHAYDFWQFPFRV